MKVRCTGYKTSERNFTIEKTYKDNDVAFPTIVIQTNGHIVAATVYNNRDCIKQAFAKCHSEDKFDYETGAKLALERLFDDIKVISVGDTVKVVDCGESYSSYTNWITKNAPEYAVYYKYGCKVPPHTVGTVVKKRTT